MGLRGLLRSAAAANRRVERHRDRVSRAASTAHDTINRTIRAFDAELEKDVQKVERIEERYRGKPITASGVEYDLNSHEWKFDTIRDDSGKITWHFNIEAESDAMIATGSVQDGDKSYTLQAVCATRWATYAAFAVKQVKGSAKPTKLITKSDPSKNRVFLSVSGKLYQAKEGNFDAPVVGLNSKAALVAFETPTTLVHIAGIDFHLNTTTVNISIDFEEREVFRDAIASPTLADALRAKLAARLSEIEKEADSARAHIDKMSRPSSGCSAVLLTLFAVFGFGYILKSLLH